MAMESTFGMVVMRKNVLIRCCMFVFVGLGGLWLSPQRAQADDEFNRVRRIYIEGARFMQEKRYADAVPMLGQAYTMLSRAVKKGSKNKRSLRALRKLRYFLGYSHYQVGATKAKSKDKDDKAFTRKHFSKAVPLLERYAKEGKSAKRRKESAKLLLLAKAWLKKNPKPIKKVKPKIIVVGSKKGRIRAWPFIILGVGVLTAGAGAVTAGVTLGTVGQRDELHSTLEAARETGTDTASGEVARLHRQAESMATVTYVLWGVGGAITAVGVLLAATMGRAPPPKTPPTTPAPSKSTAILWKGGDR